MRKFIAVSSIILSFSLLFGCGAPAKNTEGTPPAASSESTQQTGAEKHFEEAIQTLKLPFNGTGSHVLIGDTLYFAASDTEAVNDYAHLVEYDMKTGNHKILYTSEHQEPRMQALSVNENWLIWNDINAWGAGLKVCAMNRRNGKIKEIPIDKKVMIHSTPVLDGDYAYISQGSNDELDVCEFDLKSSTRRILGQIKDRGKLSDCLVAKDGNIVWLDRIDGKPHYIVCNRDSDKIESYPTQHKFIDSLALTKNMVFSRNTDDRSNEDIFEISAFNIKDRCFLLGLSTTVNFNVTEDYLLSYDGMINIYKIENDKVIDIDAETIDSEPDWTVSKNNMLIATTDPIKENGKLRGYSEIQIISLDKLV